MRLKDFTIKVTQNEEDLSKKMNALGDISLDISDYGNSKKVKEIIDKTKNAKTYFIDHNNKFRSLYKKYT